MRPTGRNVFQRAPGPRLLQGRAGPSSLLRQGKIAPPLFLTLVLAPGKETLPCRSSESPLAASEGSSNRSLKLLFALHFISLFPVLNGLGQESCQGWDGHPASQSMCCEHPQRSGQRPTAQHASTQRMSAMLIPSPQSSAMKAVA